MQMEFDGPEAEKIATDMYIASHHATPHYIAFAFHTPLPTTLHRVTFPYHTLSCDTLHKHHWLVVSTPLKNMKVS